MRDIHSDIKVSRAVSPAAAITDDTALVSEILDTANFAANELVILVGALADGNAEFTVVLEESDAANMDGAAAVADSDLLGTEDEAVTTGNTDNETRKLGYRGSKRYIRATITPDGNTGDAYIAAVWLQGGARKKPTS